MLALAPLRRASVPDEELSQERFPSDRASAPRHSLVVLRCKVEITFEWSIQLGKTAVRYHNDLVSRLTLESLKLHILHHAITNLLFYSDLTVTQCLMLFILRR